MGQTQAVQPPRVLVVGAGAIGALYGGMLARAGAEVTVVCRSDYDAVYRRRLRYPVKLGEFVSARRRC